MDRTDPFAQATAQDVALEELTPAGEQPAAGTSIGERATPTALEGSWLATDASVAGRPARQIVGQHLIFRGNRFQITRDGEVCYGGKVTVDPAAAPATLDLDQSETRTLKGVWLGIYQVEGDRLTICDNALNMAKPRPTAFATSAEDRYVQVRFTREA